MEFEQTFPAMGTSVDVLVSASTHPAAAFVSLQLLFEQQEAKFSRFRPGSLLSRLNAGETITDGQLAAACRMAIEAHEFTRGMFNPMILPALQDAGYDRTFAEVAGGAPRSHQVPVPGDALDIDGGRVSLRHGQLDLGGIVKGWTVDLAVEAFASEFDGMLLNAGGDLRCSGSEDGADGWYVELDGPSGLAWSGTMTGALATSSVLKRSWTSSSGQPAHHLIDPRTGLPAESPFAQASAWGSTTWRAECWAKAVLIGGAEIAAEARAAGYRILCLDREGTVVLDLA